MRRSLSSSDSSRFESFDDAKLEIPGFVPRPQFMTVNRLQFFGLETINSFINGFSFLSLSHHLEVNPIQKLVLESFEKRFVSIIEKIKEEPMDETSRELFKHLIQSGLCTRSFMFKKIINCETDIEKVAKQLGLPITAKLKCTECNAFRIVR